MLTSIVIFFPHYFMNDADLFAIFARNLLAVLFCSLIQLTASDIAKINVTICCFFIPLNDKNNFLIIFSSVVAFWSPLFDLIYFSEIKFLF